MKYHAFVVANSFASPNEEIPSDAAWEGPVAGDIVAAPEAFSARPSRQDACAPRNALIADAPDECSR